MLLFPLALMALVAAQDTVQNSWIAPSLPDMSTTITEGVPYTLTWDDTLQNWFASYSPESNPTNVTLWIAALQLSYSHIIQQYVDVTRVRQITWTPSLPAVEYAEDQYWSFRFLPSNYTSLSTPGAANEEIDSPQIIYKAASSTTSASSSASSTATAASTSSTSSLTLASPTSSPSPATTTPPRTSSSSPSLSSGAIAGTAIGSVLGLALLAALVYLLLRLRRAERKTESYPPSSLTYVSSGTGGQGEMSSVSPSTTGQGPMMMYSPLHGAAEAPSEYAREPGTPGGAHELAAGEVGEVEGEGGKK